MSQERKQFVLTPREEQMVEPLLRFLKPELTEGAKEMVINRPNEVAYEMLDGTWKFVDAPDLDINQLTDIIRFFADRTRQKFDYSNPILSLKLPGGHRAQVIAGTQNNMKFSMAVRLHSDENFDIHDYKITEEDKRTIIEAVKKRRTLLISGGTGAGKTSFMNAILKFIPEEERLITLEDVRELKVPHRNWIALTFFEDKEGKSNVNELLNACLRMRPDRILLGEIRKENAFTFCSAINTGHQGSMATVHANDPNSAMDAVINRALLNGDVVESAITVLRRQLEADIYAVVQVERAGADGARAYVKVLQEKMHPQEEVILAAAPTG